MNYSKRLLILIISVATSVVVEAKEQSFEGKPPMKEQWSTSAVFNQPESAAFDHVRKQIFVSNVNGYAKDGNGFISRIGGDDQRVELEWVTGLDSPTGLTVAGDYLYAVDYDQLHIISINSRKIVKSYAAPDEKPGLNDVVVSSDHGVFVTGSASATIYHLEDEKLVVWMQDDDVLKHANGLFISGDRLLFGGAQWKVFELSSKKELAIGLATKPTFVEIDGITADGCGGVIVTLLDDKRLWRVTADGESGPLSSLQLEGIDLHHHDGTLFIPRVGGVLSTYTLQFKDC